MKKLLPLAIITLLIFTNALLSMPLSKRSIERLKASGKLEEVAGRFEAAVQRNMRETDIHHSDILTKMRNSQRDDEITLYVPVVIVDFDDNEADDETYPVEHYEDMLFSEDEYETGSMRDWYFENSYGEVTILGEIVGWYRLEEDYAYYVDGQNGQGNYPRNSQGLCVDAAEAANDDIDFGDFDNDGDGTVEALYVVFAGEGAEANEGDEDLIWSHAWGLGGRRVRHDGVWINSYTVVPEDGKIGVFGHELGHALFDLPDLYDRTYESNGLGDWSMMSFGSWGGGGTRPSHFDAWCKKELGFVQEVVLEWDEINFEIPPVEEMVEGDDPRASVYYVWTDGQFEDEYYILENRQEIGFDESLPGFGLMVYHIDEAIGNDQNDNAWYPDHEDDGHFLVALEQADGNWDMEQDENYGDEGDPFPGSSDNDEFNQDSSPSSANYDGDNTSIQLNGISVEDGLVSIEDLIIGRSQRGSIVYFEPEVLEFGDVEVGESSTNTLTLVYQFHNANDETVIEDFALNVGEHFEIDANIMDQLPIVLPDDEDVEIDIEITFTPGETGEIEDVFEVYSDDPRYPEDDPLTCSLLGTGANTPPEVVNPIPDQEEDEDFDRYAIADLDAVFADENGDELEYSWDTDEDELELELDEDNRFWLSVAENWNGEGTVTVIADDGFEEQRIQGRVRQIRRGEDKNYHFPRRDDIAEDEFIITVNPVNDAPFWLEVADYEVMELDTFDFEIQADDVDLEYEGDELALSMTDGPEEAFFIESNDNTAIFFWITTLEDQGFHEVSFQVEDEAGETAEMTFEIFVMNLNQAPEWTEEPENVEADEGAEIDFSLETSDPDGDDLEITMFSDDLPEEAEFTDIGNGRGRFFWETTFEDAGEYFALFVATDGEEEINAAITITVGDVNRAPVWEEIPESITVDETDTIEFTISGSDPDGDDLTISMESEDLPEEVEFIDNGDGSADFSWQTNYTDAGEYTATFTLSDGVNVVSADVLITVMDINRPPEWEDPPLNLDVDAGDLLEFSYEAMDLDDDEITLELQSEDLPDAAEFTDNGDGTADFSWQTVEADTGIYDVMIVASDGELADTAEFTITVNPSQSVENGSRVVPTEFALHAVYPNPFNAELTVVYDVPASGTISLFILEQSGRKVTDLFSGHSIAGRHSAVWNGRATGGSNAASGLYFVVLKGADRIVMKKALLIR